MRKFLTSCLGLVWLFLQVSPVAAVVTELASFRNFLYGTEQNCAYDDWVSHLSEGRVSNLNIYAPWETQNNDFGDFHVPTSLELSQWAEVMDAWLALDLNLAQSKVDQYGFPYQVVNFQDLDSGRNIYMLRETLNEDIDENGTEDPLDDEVGSFDYGWGLYVFNPSASRPIIVTAPHPCDDYPSPVFALESFLTLDARFLFIAGAGREVAYTPPYNTNNASLSDPSRNPDHPFNVAYQRAADQIRGLTGRIEFSLQIHSYDWNKYPSQPNVMLSAGNGRFYPCLPIRDESRVGADLLKHTPYLVHPQNSIGTHSAVEIDDYYAVYYSSDDQILYTWEDQAIILPRNVDLPGAQANQQMLYTEQQNIHDVYSPFLHVEMDELPKNYARTEANWFWFFGYDADTQTWNREQRYDRFIAYYTPWLSALNEVLDQTLTLDDFTAPSNPENLRLEYLTSSQASIAWDRSYSFDFDSYVVNLRWIDNGLPNYRELDRHTHPALARQSRTTLILDLPGGPSAGLYYIQVLARDKHANLSMPSNELKVWTQGSPLSSVAISTTQSSVMLGFSSPLSVFRGFNILRSVGSGAFFRYASWAQNPALLPQVSGSYAFLDEQVNSGEIYRYQIAAEFADGLEIFHWQTLDASPNPIYELSLSDTAHQLSTIFRFGANPLATDGSDSYDSYVSTYPSSFQFGTFLSSTYSLYTRDIRSYFEPSQGFRKWQLRYRPMNNPANLVLTPDPQLLATGHCLLIYDVNRGYWHDLRQGPYSWTSYGGTAWQDLDLYWGKRPPQVIVETGQDQFHWLGDVLSFEWNLLNRVRVSSLDLKLEGSDHSLTLATGISPTISQLSTLATEPVSGAQLVFLLHLTDGTTQEFRTQSRWSVVPHSFVRQYPPGYSLLSAPFETPLDIGEALGEGAQAYTLSPLGEWESVAVVPPGSACLLKTEQAQLLNQAVALPSGSVTFPLQNGWNLLSNPYYHNFPLASLNFLRSGQNPDFATLVEESQLAPYILLLGERGWQLSTQLPPGEAALLCYLGTEPLSVIFDPGTHAHTPTDFDPQWTMSLSLDNGFLTADAIQPGIAASATAFHDPLLDLPKPPALPDATYRISLQNPTDAIPVSAQNSYQGLFPWYNETEKTWAFQIETDSLQPLRLTLEAESLPPGYSIEIRLNGQSIPLSGSGHYWFDPPAPGFISGSLIVRNYLPAADIPPEPESVTAYPNPFRDQLRISVPSGKSETGVLGIYNLRGQLVRQLSAKDFSVEDQSYLWNGQAENGKPVASGIYLLRYRNISGLHTGKIIKH